VLMGPVLIIVFLGVVVVVVVVVVTFLVPVVFILPIMHRVILTLIVVVCGSVRLLWWCWFHLLVECWPCRYFVESHVPIPTLIHVSLLC
jgi:hypothetical protein